jgi:hypothetical protein
LRRTYRLFKGALKYWQMLLLMLDLCSPKRDSNKWIVAENSEIPIQRCEKSRSSQKEVF